MARLICPSEHLEVELFSYMAANNLRIPDHLQVHMEQQALEDAAIPRAEVVRVLSKSDFALHGATSSSQTFPIANGIDSSRWRTASLAVRLYSQGAWPLGSLVQVQVGNVLITDVEPSIAPTDTRATTITIAAGASPGLSLRSLPDPIGPQLYVSLKASMSTTAGQQTFTIGIDLVGRAN